MVIADEPVSALDVSVQAQILNLMRSLQARHAMSYLFIAHNLAVVRYLSDRVAIMYLGRIVELASRAEIFARPKHPVHRAAAHLLTQSRPDRPQAAPSQGGREPFVRHAPGRLSVPSALSLPRTALYRGEAGAGGEPARKSGGSHQVACHLHEQLSLRTFVD